ncbi:MAG: M48 family metalloprotease [Nevskiaceae bacterium]|jgi:predicted Zn-dependent protease|nr:M48 family metalloprotease [Nevskiaceae bacterium]
MIRASTARPARLALFLALLQITAPALPQAVPDSGRSAFASLPDLGSGANALISRQEEHQIGRMMMRDLRRENLVLDDPESTEYINALGSRLGAEAQDGEHKLSYFVVRDRAVNAFAIPGGFIGTNVGLILLTDHESELAGVLAHETGHVVQRHIARSVEAQGRNSIASIAGLLGAILIGAISGSPDAVPGLISIAQATAMQQSINFTRMEEHEADRVGIGYLASAGFDPNGMAGFFGTMMRSRGVSNDLIPPLLLSHPVDTVRIAEARARAAAMPPVTPKPDSASYLLIRERLRVITAPPDGDLRIYYDKQLEANPDSMAIKYGAALAEIRWGDAKAAAHKLAKMAAQNPELPLFQTALAQAQLASGDKAAALATFEKGLALSPRNVPLTVHYAEALMQADKPKKAHELLLDLFNNVPPTPEQIRLTALAASAAGDLGDAYYYMSEFHISNGDLMLANTQLDMALASPEITDVQRKRFFARREEIRDVLREERGGRPAARPN